MPNIETDKVRELHSITLTLKDILKELKRFNRNYELIHTTQCGPTVTMDRTDVMLLSKENICSANDNTENRKE